MDDTSRLIAGEAARHHGNRSPKPQLIRHGANHVYVVDDMIVRIAISQVDAARDIRIGEFLKAEGLAVPEPIGSGEVDGSQYSIWEYVKPDVPQLLDFVGFGVGIRSLHAIDPAGLIDLGLPWCDEPDWLNVDRGLVKAREAQVVSDEDIDLLEMHAERLRFWGDRCRSARRHVVCHGDVHPQNAIMRNGQVIIIDWDTICFGPPQWDHAALMTLADRWGGVANAYDEFSDGYGETFEGDPLAPEMTEVRLLAPTVNMIIKGADSPRHANEARLRMGYWRREHSPPTWSPQ